MNSLAATTLALVGVTAATVLAVLDEIPLVKVRVPRFRCRLIGTYSDGGIYRCKRRNNALRFMAGG